MIITSTLEDCGVVKLQRYRNNKAIECGHEPADNEPALCAKVARLSASMLDFAHEPKDVVILDKNGKPLLASGPRPSLF